MGSESSGWEIRVQGVVQSVGFRPFVKNLADRLGVLGEIQNLGSAGVKIVINTSADQRDTFLTAMQKELPDLAYISHIDIKPINSVRFQDFTILQSEKSDSVGGVALPPDISICNECYQDILHDPRRKKYPFTSCTNCGPRYSAIRALPYDRINTSYQAFPLCPECENEYSTPSNRRFHAQTTACRTCGPSYRFYQSSENTWIEQDFDFKHIAHELERGQIVALMGLGGTHILCNPFDDSMVNNLRRRRRHNSNKPFALLVRDLGVARRFTSLTPEDEKLLTSKRRPILVVPHKSKFSNVVSPNLNTIGIVLPYAGVHHVLFEYLNLDAVIFTSANLPGQPMPITKDEVLTQMNGLVDIAVVHNREIIQRIDDSVIRSHGTHHHIIRRARGYTPQPIFHNQLQNLDNLISLGAEEVNTASLGLGELIIPTQHLGHLISTENLSFQQEAISHLLNLYEISPRHVILDLHPTFMQRINAAWLTEQYGADQFEVQHHVAHAASLALDQQLSLDEEFLVWTCDGFGYGTDGNAWGGELILLTQNAYERKSNFPEIRYDGGDINAKYPDRMLYLLLQSLGLSTERFEFKVKHGSKELKYLSSLSNSPQQLLTTSSGRFLDAVSSLLDCCHYRTYRGEPAMVLEGLAFQDKPIIEPEVFVNAHTLDLKNLLSNAISHVESRQKTSAIAYWVLESLGISMAEVARTYSELAGVNKIGFSGGVAYNEIICRSMQDYLTSNNIVFVTHSQVPPGDAGISPGQIFYHEKVQN